MNNDMLFMNYDPRKHPCKDCTERHAYCHGHCEREKAFNESRPKKKPSSYIDYKKMKDPFHKKGRVIKHG